VIVLNVSEVAALHEKLIDATGGSRGLRDAGLLESAVMNCYQSFGDDELYPSVTEKAAHMAFGLCKNHPFVDGNKRTAVAAMLVMLRVNDIELSYSQPELVALALGIAGGEMDYEHIVEWVRYLRPGRLAGNARRLIQTENLNRDGSYRDALRRDGIRL
jgi:death-on-curing protein